MAETKEKNDQKKMDKKNMCTEEELYRKKTPKASGHASIEGDINKTKLHTLSRNA